MLLATTMLIGGMPSASSLMMEGQGSCQANRGYDWTVIVTIISVLFACVTMPG